MAVIAPQQLGIGLGCEWVIEAMECDANRLRDLVHLREMFDDLIRALDLHPVAESQWHQFPGAGGLTGLCLLSESHLACHTFPEYASMCLNIFCCRQRDGMDFESYLRVKVGARRIRVRRLERQYLNQ